VTETQAANKSGLKANLSSIIFMSSIFTDYLYGEIASLSLNLHEKPEFFFFKITSQKVSLISTVPVLPGNMSGENIKC